MNTLYISDLDGTLLNQDGVLSSQTRKDLQELINQGVHFTCATARTSATVSHILKDINLSAPAILMNGVVILDLKTQTYIKVEYLQKAFCLELIKELEKHNLTSFIYSLIRNQLVTYYDKLYNDSMYEFYKERVTLYQKPYTKVASLSDINPETIIYSLLLDKKEALQPLVDWLCEVKATYDIDFCFYPEIYLKDTWCLEIFSHKATKYNAAQFIRKEYGYDTIIGFGDNLNDLSLFMACDEAYAVQNAKPEVKAAATKVIGSNIENGVTTFIKDEYNTSARKS